MAVTQILAARLRERITIEQVTETQDSQGGISESWATYAVRQAGTQPLNGREFFEAQQTASQTDYRFRLRYDDLTKSITTKMRITWKSRTFDITGVINESECNREIIIMAVERHD